LLVTQPDFRAPPTKPVYPRRAIDLGLEGEVLVRARIDEAGDPLEPAVWRSSGHPLLDRAAIEAVRRWRFKPALRNGRAVTAIVQVPISFRLQ
jgi:protein TonB